MPLGTHEDQRRQWHSAAVLLPGKSHGWRSLVVHGVAESWTQLSDFPFTSLSCTGEGNGNPLQCSCLENPRDREAWWASVDGVGHDWRDLAACMRIKEKMSWNQLEIFFFLFLIYFHSLEGNYFTIL